MINTSDPALENDEVLKIQLAVFKSEHRDLDDAIGALVEKGTADQLTLQRLKKRKLALKDKISRSSRSAAIYRANVPWPISSALITICDNRGCMGRDAIFFPNAVMPLSFNASNDLSKSIARSMTALSG